MRVVADVECERGDFPVTWRIGIRSLSGQALGVVRSERTAIGDRPLQPCRRGSDIARAYVEIRFNLLVILERGEVRWR